MPKLKTSEQRLLIIVGILAFCLLNFYLYGELVHKRDKMTKDFERLTQRQFRLQGLLDERALWEDRRRWVGERLPAYRTIDDRDTHLITFVRHHANTTGLEIFKENPLPSKLEANYEETAIDVGVQGEIEPVIRWLYSLQDPEKFRSITSLSMKKAKSRGDSTEIRLEITLSQWWSPESQKMAAENAAAVSTITGGEN